MSANFYFYLKKLKLFSKNKKQSKNINIKYGR